MCIYLFLLLKVMSLFSGYLRTILVLCDVNFRICHFTLTYVISAPLWSYNGYVILSYYYGHYTLDKQIISLVQHPGIHHRLQYKSESWSMDKWINHVR